MGTVNGYRAFWFEIFWMLCIMNKALQKNPKNNDRREGSNVKVRQDLSWKNIIPHLWLTPNHRRGGHIHFDNEWVWLFCNNHWKSKNTFGTYFSYGQICWEKEFWGFKVTWLPCFDANNLPFALKGILAPRPRMAMMRISKAFRRVCSKIWDPSEFESF